VATVELTAESVRDDSLSRDQVEYGFRLLAITTFCMTLALSLFDSIQASFFRDSLGMDGQQNGYLIAIREVPGFLLIFISAVMLRKGLAKATAISLLVAGVGFSLFAFVHSFEQAIIPILICSIGYHSWLQLQYALGLSLARHGEEGSTLGRLQGIGFLGTFLALGLVWLALQGSDWILKTDEQDPILRFFWIFSGTFAIVGSFVVRKFPESPRDREIARNAPKITWNPHYWLYYVLTTLDGSRQQIYFAFGLFVLVERFDAPAKNVVLMLIFAALLKFLLGEPVGGTIDRFGERPVLTVAYCLHFITFLGFALAPNIWVAYGCYLLYQFLTLLSIGTTTYIKKVAKREDLAPTLAMGVSLAHVTAIFVPIIGATLWDTLGYRFPFYFGLIFVVGSLFFTQKINIPAQTIRDQPSEI
jgi:MFS family permease